MAAAERDAIGRPRRESKRNAGGRAFPGGRSPARAYMSRARSRSTNFWILPVEVLGSGPNTTVFGTL